MDQNTAALEHAMGAASAANDAKSFNEREEEEDAEPMDEDPAEEVGHVGR